jgi:hypothetical protein
MATRSLAAGLGLRWGDGVLNFEGRNHAFRIKGLGVGEIGAAIANSLGDVSNLERLDQFAGSYVAVEAAATAGTGAGVLKMRNEHGVVITLKASERGVRLALGTQALHITLQ